MSEKTHKVVVGLGNPGPRYALTRHNIGFFVLEELLKRRNLEFQISESEYLATSHGLEEDNPVLIKPLTYMNLSGEALVSWAERSGEKLTGLPWVFPEPDEDDSEPTEPWLPSGIRPLIICDDLVLPLGAVRLRGKGSSGGQNGVQSIIDELGGDEFPRLRLGVAPMQGPVAPEFWADFVLAEFEEDEWETVKDVVQHAADAVEFWLENSTEKTASRFNRRRRPDK